jgi:hypothetical protein
VRATTAFLLPILLVPILSLRAPIGTTAYPTDYFRSPLGIPLVLSGNYAEMRDGHFHGGLDIKTRDSEGYRIYAAADGYVERVKVSPYGYGNAIYIAHPNGYTTVYAHLSRFKGPIASFVRSTQYNRQSFELDQYLKADRFPIKKGQVIALSGNSGSSSGPHLHFEVRTSSDQVPINPLLFGFSVADSRTPRIFRVKIYPIGEKSGVVSTSDQTDRRPTDPLTLNVKATGDTYSIENSPTIRAWGQIGFGIQTHDYHDGSRSRLGAYRIRLMINGETHFLSEMERISFADTRYIHAHVDFEERRQNRRWIQRSYRLPGNRLPIYQLTDDGIVNVTPGRSIDATYIVEDAAGNKAELRLAVNGSDVPDNGSMPVLRQMATLARFDAPFVMEHDGFRAELPANALYENTRLSYTADSTVAGAFSRVHEFHNGVTPVHLRYSLSIRPDALPEDLRSKALIATIDDDGDVSAAGGKYSNGFVTTRPRSFGRFFVSVDTTAPSIASLDLEPEDKIGRRTRFRFRIKDELSGIADYDGYIDGHWSLFSYDAKRDVLTYDLDPALAIGRHVLRVDVVDRKGNKTSLAVPFIR